MKATFRKLFIFGAVSGIGSLAGLQYIPKIQENRTMQEKFNFKPLSKTEELGYVSPLPTRETNVDNLESKEFDILVVGGGATGTGVALDAITRGLSVALVEKFDFASGTSSRSTKLIHGGVRYLQKAIMSLDLEQYNMVREALTERAHLVEVAPHLAKPIPIMLPLYKWWQLPYYWAGIKMYDIVSGSRILKASYYLSKSRALEQFPMLNKNELKGAIVYYDGQQNDARMNLSLAMTAARLGAVITNYTEVESLTRNASGRLTGAHVRDCVSGRKLTVKARCIVNATGPYTDFLRLQADPGKARPICAPSSGIHITLPNYYSPAKMGLLDPATKDGRVIFFLPWQGHTIAGTTDNACPVTDSPTPSEDEVQFILEEIRHYLTPDVKVRRGDVLSAWSGIRPLVRDPSKSDTQSLARNHIIEVGQSGLITIAGGKWTTYRHMAEEAVDAAIAEHNMKPARPCQTNGMRVEGGHTFTPNIFIHLSQDFGLESQVAEHLASTYGDRAIDVAQISALTGKRWPLIGVRLHPDYPYLESEVVYACNEYARRVVDVVARRTRMSFLNAAATMEVLPKIADIMAKELKWDKKKRAEELKFAENFVMTEMGLDLRNDYLNVPINFSHNETSRMIRRFHLIDSDRKGYITIQDLRKHLTENEGSSISEAQLCEILNEVDTNRNGEIDQTEFLQFMSALKTGAVGDSRFGRIIDRAATSIDRSGGGL